MNDAPPSYVVDPIPDYVDGEDELDLTNDEERGLVWPPVIPLTPYQQKVLEYGEHKIDVFAEAMKQEFRANRWKGDWFKATPEELVNDVHYHLSKLHVAMRRPGSLGDPCTCVVQTIGVGYQGEKEAIEEGEHDNTKCAGNNPILEFAADVGVLLMMAMDAEQLLGIMIERPTE